MRVIYFILGAGIGAPLRYLIDKFFRAKYKFPVGILIVNTVGSFVLGLTQLNYFVMGFCGAFTTWSALALELDQELTKGEKRKFLINLGLNLFLGFGAAALGASI